MSIDPVIFLPAGPGHLAIRIVPSPRRKRMALFVSHLGEVEARVPALFSQTAVNRFIAAHVPWILHHTEKRRTSASSPPGPGMSLPYLGETLTLCLHPGARLSYALEPGFLHLTTPDPDPARLPDLLSLWYRREARRHLRARLDHWSRVMGIAFWGMTVRNQKSRWGSCSGRGGISLNWRLLLAAPEVVDYVLVHELSHRLFPDHSPAFWEQVAAFVPDHKALRARLKGVREPW